MIWLGNNVDTEITWKVINKLSSGNIISWEKENMINWIDWVITNKKIATWAITNEKIANNAVNSRTIVDGSIKSMDIWQKQITSLNIVNSAITSKKLAKGSVTIDKLDPTLFSRLKSLSGKAYHKPYIDDFYLYNNHKKSKWPRDICVLSSLSAHIKINNKITPLVHCRSKYITQMVL